MLDISRLSADYLVRRLDRRNLTAILALQEENPLYYQHCPPQPSIGKILEDMVALPPGKRGDDKYYLGFFDGKELVAVMDLIVAYPHANTVFIGFFMMAARRSGQGAGSGIILTALKELKAEGYSFARLGYMKGNQQSKAFWEKCGFVEAGLEVRNNQGTMVILSKEL